MLPSPILMFGKAVFPFMVESGKVTGVRVKVADFVEYDPLRFSESAVNSSDKYLLFKYFDGSSYLKLKKPPLTR